MLPDRSGDAEAGVVTTRQIGQVALLTINRPDIGNAIDQATIDALNAALDLIEAGPQQALVITGNGAAFSAGVNAGAVDDDKFKRQRDMYALALRLAAFPKVRIAAVNGVAHGGGLELALYCTLRVAGHTAQFGFPEILRSLMPGYGGTQLLPRLVGREHALRILLSGDAIDATTAKEIGLISEIAADPVIAACEMARRCSRGGFAAQLAVRMAVEEGGRLSLSEALALEARLVAPLPTLPKVISAQKQFAAPHSSKAATHA